MASVIFMGLALVGAYLNNNKISSEKRKLSNKKTNPSKDIQRRNVYDTRRLKKIYRDIDIRAEDLWNKSKETKETNIVPEYYNSFIEPDDKDNDKLEQRIKDAERRKKIAKYEGSLTDDSDLLDNDDNIFGDHTLLFENSNKLINNSHYKRYLDKTRKKKQSFTDQFEEARFNSKGPANAENSLHLDLERGLKEGFSVIGPNPSNEDMTYGMVDKKDFKHNNMVPFFSGKSYGDFNDSWDHVKQNKVDLFTGSSREYKRKKEQAPLFNPFKDLTHSYGMPSTTDYRHNRYYSSLGRERRNETLFQPQRVAPGVNQGYNAYGIDGFHPSYRCLPKTIDELRPANRPQITYSAPVKPGFKRNMRPVQAPVQKNRPERYREELKRNMVKNLGYIRAPKVRDNYYLKETNKETTLREHYGVAGNSETSVGRNVPIEMIPKIAKTKRQVYKHPGISNLSNSNRWDEKYLNWLQKSYFFPHNERSTTQFNQHLLAPKRGQGTVAYNPKEFRAKNTIKELTENNQHLLGPKRGGQGTIAFNPKDFRAKTTIREMTENNQHILGAKRGQGSIVYDPKAIARNTIKETTENNQHVLGPNRGGHGTVAFKPAEYRAKNTVKETTENNQHVLGPSRGKATVAFSPELWRAKNTIKETTENNQHIVGVSGINKGGVVYDPSGWKARNTIREITENNQHLLGPGRAGRGTIAFDPEMWRSKGTVKETTENNQHLSGVGRGNRGTVAFDPEMWRAKNTVKETTENNQHLIGVGKSERGTVAFDPKTWRAKNTVKETTENNQHLIGVGKSGRGTVAYDSSSVAKTTIKETTENNQHLTGIGRGNRGTVAFDPAMWRAKNTVKETTENNQHILGASGIKNGTVAYDPTSVAKTTIRETTENNQYLTGVSRVNRGTVAFDPKLWRAKNTVKETTENNQHILGASGIRKGTVAYDPTSVAKTTVRETTENNQHILGVSGVKKGSIAYDPNDTARKTIRQLTENNQHLLGASGVKQGTVAFDPKLWRAKNTIKELTENNQHVLGASGVKQGTVAYDPDTWKAKNTIKELTENNQHILGPGKGYRGGRAYDPEDRPSTTIKELTEHQQHILGASKGNQGTVAYDPVAWEARGTNRQTTQNTYYVSAGHAYDAEAPRVYDAEYNAQIDECKEVVAMSGRAPTQSNYPKGPVPDMTNYRLKNPINIEREEIPDCRALNSLYRMPVNITKTRMVVPQEERRLDEAVLAGLDSNPFSIPSYFNDCTQHLLK